MGVRILQLLIHKTDKYTSNGKHQILPTCSIKDKHKTWDLIKFYVLYNVNDFSVKISRILHFVSPRENYTCIISTKTVKCRNYICLICTKNFIQLGNEINQVLLIFQHENREQGRKSGRMRDFKGYYTSPN